MIAPSGARPSVAKRQIAIKSLRAKATIAMRRFDLIGAAGRGPSPICWSARQHRKVSSGAHAAQRLR